MRQGAASTEIDVLNTQTIEEIKMMWIATLGDKAETLTADRVRLFFMGKELKDDLFAYSYNMNKDSVLQAMIR